MTAVLIKVTVALALSLLSVRLARRRRAAVRHALLASGFAIVLLLPMVSMVSPMIVVALPIDARVGAIESYTIPMFGNTTDRGVTARAPDAGPIAAAERRLSLGTLLAAAWMTGAMVLLVPVLAGLWEMRRIRRGARRWRQLEHITRHVALAAGLKRPIDVLVHDGVAGPMTCGVLRPAIILPADAADWSESDVRRALVHECEHVRRADWLTHCLARIACALYWFHPLVWIAWRELLFEAERACDDAVVIRADAEPYADQLLTLAQRLSAARRYPQLAMANSRDLPRRVFAVLDDAQERGRAGRRCLSSVVAGAVVLMAVLTPLSVVGRAELLGASAQISSPTTNRPIFEVASVRRNIQDSGMMGGECRGSEGGGTDNSGGGIAAMAKAAGFAPISPGRCRFTRLTLKELIAYAYAIPPRDVERMVVGGPRWIDGDRFDVEAKSGTLVPVAEMRLMLQQMLADRFKLRLHREPRELQGYALVVAAGGPKLQEATGSEPRTGMATIGGGPVTAWKTTMPMLATYLSLRLGRPVEDQTALKGMYNFTLSWTPGDDERPRFDSRNLPPEIREKLQSNADQSGTSVFTALQEQLGLRLVSRQVTGEILVVDAADLPSEN